MKKTIIKDNVKIESEFTREFRWKDCPSAGFTFICDENGKIELDSLNPEAKVNAEMALNDGGEKLIDLGVQEQKTEIKLCHCGSKKDRILLSDARGIPVGYCCDDCMSKFKSKYRSEIFTNPNYSCPDCDIEPEDY